MKKTIVFATIMCLGIALFGCGKKEASPETVADTIEMPTEAPTSTPVETPVPTSTPKIIETPVPTPTLAPKLFFDDTVYPAQRDGKWGVLSESGEVIIGFIYDEAAETFNDGYWMVNIRESGWGYIDATGAEIVPLQYAQIGEFSEGLCPVKEDRDSAWGAVDGNNNWVVPASFEELFGFHEGLAVAKKEGYYGFVDTTGTAKIPFTFDTVFDEKFKSGAAAVKINDAWGAIDKTGEYIVPLKKNYSIWGMTSKNIIFHNGKVEYDVNTYHIYDSQGGLIRDDVQDLAICSDENILITTTEIGDFGDGEVQNGYYYEKYLIDGSGNTLFTVSDLVNAGVGAKNDEIGDIGARYIGNGWFEVWGEEFFRDVNYRDEHYFERTGKEWCNVVNANGQHLSDTWYGRTSDNTHQRILTAYNSISWMIPAAEDGINTLVYRVDGEFVKEVPGDWEIATDETMLENGYPYKCVSLVDGSEYLTDDNAPMPEQGILIVSDDEEIFWSLYANGKLVYPLEYTAVNYSYADDVFTLEKGSVQTKVRIARDGTVIELIKEDSEVLESENDE